MICPCSMVWTSKNCECMCGRKALENKVLAINVYHELYLNMCLTEQNLGNKRQEKEFSSPPNGMGPG